MRVLVTGAGGMLGSEMLRLLGDEATGLTRAELDVTDLDAVRDAIATHRPDAVLNAAAFTDVDDAESHREAAFAVNATGAANVATAAAEASAYCVHVSTDFVFDGTLGRAYREDDEPNPICVYAASKLEGERLARGAHPGAAVARTAWVYGAGHRTFLSQVLDRARAGETIRVVTDQAGSPTYVRDLAAALRTLLAARTPGVFHVAGGGVATRYEFARAIVEAAGEDASRVEPVATSELPPRPAPRPAYAPLEPAAWRDAGFAPLRDWREALAEAIGDFT